MNFNLPPGCTMRDIEQDDGTLQSKPTENIPTPRMDEKQFETISYNGVRQEVVFLKDAQKIERELVLCQRKLKVTELKARGSLANNLCPDHRDKQNGKPCLACENERLKKDCSQLIARVNDLTDKQLDGAAAVIEENLQLRTALAKCLREQSAECFPEENGQKHFARLIMEGVADELDAAFNPPNADLRQDAVNGRGA